jgi:RND family efflux transporter MFP subunit
VKKLMSGIMTRTGNTVLFLMVIVFASVMMNKTALAQQKPRAAAVEVDEVILQPIDQTVPIIGRLVARRGGIVSSRARGPVLEMKVEVGDRVSSDDVLAVLVQDRLKHVREQQIANLNEKKAEMATRNSQVKIVEQNIRRLEKLRNSKSAAFRVALHQDKQLEKAILMSQVAEARAAISRARINISLAELDLEYTIIRAPYPGVVTRVHTEAGAYLDVGDQVASLIDDSALEIEADIPVERIPAVTRGAKVRAVVAGFDVIATVRAQIPEENPLTRTRAVRFTADLSPITTLLAANQTVTVSIPIGVAKEILTVHKDAILQRKGDSLVYVVKEGKAVSRSVRLGDGIGGRFEVVAGLEAGDMVVTRGNERLFPGQPVSHK